MLRTLLATAQYACRSVTFADTFSRTFKLCVPFTNWFLVVPLDRDEKSLTKVFVFPVFDEFVWSASTKQRSVSLAFDDPTTCSCDCRFPSSLKNVWYLMGRRRNIYADNYSWCQCVAAKLMFRLPSEIFLGSLRSKNPGEEFTLVHLVAHVNLIVHCISGVVALFVVPGIEIAVQSTNRSHTVRLHRNQYSSCMNITVATVQVSTVRTFWILHHFAKKIHNL